MKIQSNHNQSNLMFGNNKHNQSMYRLGNIHPFEKQETDTPTRMHINY